MTLSEIETILADLSNRHTNLDKELLTTILLSAGWEEKSIKEALILFAQFKKRKEVIATSSVVKSPTPVVVPLPLVPKVVTLSTSVVKEDITFYKTDGEEEGELHVFEETKLPPQKEIPVAVPVKEVEVTPVEQAPVLAIEEPTTPVPIVTEVLMPEVKTIVVTQEVVATEPILQAVEEEVTLLGEDRRQKDKESLITHEEIVAVVPRVVREEKIPENLPLLPFESSPHVWSFSRYKDVFHGEVMPDKIEPEYHQVSITPLESLPQKHVVHDVSLEDEIVVEKIPLNKEDESLVFLAGVMLLGIILILGYMYSHGRL